MRQRDHGRTLALVAAADARREARDPEQALDREASDRDDQLRTHQLELPRAPERAQLLLVLRRGPVAATRGGAAGIAARNRGAVEGCVELLLLEPEPAPQRLTGAATPGSPFLALDDARRLAVHVRTLAGVDVADRP